MKERMPCTTGRRRRRKRRITAAVVIQVVVCIQKQQAFALAHHRTPQRRLRFWDRDPLGLLRMSALPDEEESPADSIIQEKAVMKEGGVFTDGENLDEYCEVMDEFGCPAIEDYCNGDGGESIRCIRLEKELPKDLENIKTVQDVENKIKQVRVLQGKYGRADLIPRHWEYLEREPINGDRPPGFSIAQFNSLAEGLSAGSDFKTPFIRDGAGRLCQRDEKCNYGGFTSLPCPQVILDFSLRRWRILEALLSSDESGPCDIIAMEEIDRYRGFFAPMLRIFGFEGLFMPKGNAPGVAMGWYSDGCALFWKADVFELVSEQRKKLNVGNQVMVNAVLRHRATGKSIVVTVAHLKATNKEENELIRARQVEDLLESVNESSCRIMEEDNVDSVPAMIIGDFNAEPPSKTPYKESAVEKALRPPKGKGFRSAYEIDPPPDGVYTTLKVRGENTLNRIIDYIFYRGRLNCRAILSIPSESDLESSKLPGLRYPSDHLLIAAKFEFEK